jgi:tetratricopeptide (TPR) repeat protein
MNRLPVPSPSARRIAGVLIAAIAIAGPWRAAADPATGAGLLRLGASLSARGEYSTAEVAYRQIIDQPGFSLADQKAAMLSLAHMYRKAGTLTKAVSIYERFLQDFPEDPNTPEAFLDDGRALRDMGAYKLAIARFYSVINTTLKVTAQDFGDYSLLAKTAQFEIAQTYYESGDYDQAGKFFIRVRLLDLAPADLARATFMTGCAQERAGDLETAVATLKAFLGEWPSDPNVPEARYVLATALDGLNRPQEALGVTLDLLNAEHRLVATDAGRWNYWQRRTGNQLANQFFQNGDALDALRIYQCLAALSADRNWALPVTYQIGLCYERLYQIDDARAAYQRIVDAAKAPAGSPAPGPAIQELAGMAAWRISHLQWEDQENHRLTKLLNPGTLPPTPPATAKLAPTPTPDS